MLILFYIECISISGASARNYPKVLAMGHHFIWFAAIEKVIDALDK